VRLLLSCAAILLGVSSLRVAPDSVAQSNFPLIDAVNRYQSVWGVDVSYASNTLLDRYTHWNEPTGHDAESDLEFLLRGTGVTYFRQSSGTFFLQPKHSQIATIIGTVHSEQTGAPLRGAHIALLETSGGSTSDINGQFILSSQPAPSAKIRISHVGYLPQDHLVVLIADSTQSLNVLLKEWVIEQRPIQVTATPISDEFNLHIIDRPYQMDVRGPEELRQITGLGTPDVVRNLTDIAGLYIDVSTSDIHIQGSGLGEHQFKLDGSIIYEPIHLGLFGIFNPLAIQSVTVRKAGFDAEHGSYLAGIISAEHSLSVDKAIELQVDPISFNARLATSMDIDRSTLSVIGAFRTSIWNHWWSNLRSGSVNQLLREWNRPDEFLMRASIYPLKRVFEQGYYSLVDRLQTAAPPSIPDIGFDDIHAATELELQGGHKIGASVYTGNSNFEGRLRSALPENEIRTVPPDRHSWKNRSVRLYAQRSIADDFSWRISFRSGEYSFAHNYGGLDRQNSVHAAFNVYRYVSVETSDENGLSNYDLDLSARQQYRWGQLQAGLNLSWIEHHFRIQHVFPRVLNHERNSHISSGYLQQLWNPAPWVELTSGLRITWLRVQSKWYLEPRIALLLKSPYRGGYGVSLQLSTGVYHQFLNQFEIATISPSSIVPSTRFWLPIDETLKAPLSNHYSIDLSAQLWTDWQLGVEYYFKDQRDLYRIDYPNLWSIEVDSTEMTQINEFVTQIDGLVYGGSIELRRKTSIMDFALRFERSESKREYSFRKEEPTLIPVPWNVPQQLQIKAVYTPVDAFEGMIRWHGAWGRKWAYKRAYYDLLGSDIDHAERFEEYSFEDPIADGHHLAPFSQIDIGVAVNIPSSLTKTFKIRVDLLNVLERKNPAHRYLVERPEFGSDQRILTDESSYLIGRSFTLSVLAQW